MKFEMEPKMSPQGLKPAFLAALSGSVEAEPFQN